MKSDEYVVHQSNIKTLDHSVDYHNLGEIPNLTNEYIQNISGYDLISDEQNSVISSDNEKPGKNSPRMKVNVVSKDLPLPNKKTQKANTSLSNYSVKLTSKMNQKKKLAKCISQNIREYQPHKQRSVSRQHQYVSVSKSRKHTLKSTKSSHGRHKGKRHKDANSKTRYQSHVSPYKQTLSRNISTNKHFYGSEFAGKTSLGQVFPTKAVTNRNYTTFAPGSRQKLHQKPKSTSKDSRATGRLKIAKKLKSYLKQTDGFMNLYSKSKIAKMKNDITIIQAPTTVNKNKWFIVTNKMSMCSCRLLTDSWNGTKSNLSLVNLNFLFIVLLWKQKERSILRELTAESECEDE